MAIRRNVLPTFAETFWLEWAAPFGPPSDCHPWTRLRASAPAEKDTLIQRFPAWKYFEENKDGGRFECRTPTTWRGPWGLLSNVWSLVFSLFKATLIERYFIFFVLILRYWNNMKLWYKQKVTSIINTVLHLSISHTLNYRCSLRRYCFSYSEESFTLFKIMLKCSCKCNILIFLLVLTKQY